MVVANGKIQHVLDFSAVLSQRLGRSSLYRVLRVTIPASTRHADDLRNKLTSRLPGASPTAKSTCGDGACPLCSSLHFSKHSCIPRVGEAYLELHILFVADHDFHALRAASCALVTAAQILRWKLEGSLSSRRNITAINTRSIPSLVFRENLQGNRTEKGDTIENETVENTALLPGPFTVRCPYFLLSIISSTIVLQSTSMIPFSCFSQAAAV